MVDHYLKSSISGKPVIASNWSGHLDFLSKQLSVLVGGSLSQVPKSSFPKDMYVDGAQWFTVNYNEFLIMREVHKNYKKYTLIQKLSKINKSLYSLDKMTKELGVILINMYQSFLKKLNLNYQS